MATSKLELVNRAIAPLSIEAMRADGLSTDDIAYTLRAEHGINVSGESVRRWLASTSEPTEAAS